MIGIYVQCRGFYARTRDRAAKQPPSPTHSGSPSTATGPQDDSYGKSRAVFLSLQRCPFSNCERAESAQNLHLLRGWPI